MKKKYLPIIVLLLTASFGNVSNAVTKQEIESLIGNFICARERNIPQITPVKIPKTSANKVEPQKPQEVIPEQEKLENDPYSYEVPQKTHVQQQSRINAIKIPRATPEEAESRETKTAIPAIPTIPPTDSSTQPSDQLNEGTCTSPLDEPTFPTQEPEQNLTRQEVFLACLTKMGWANTLSLLDQLVMFEEYPDFSSLDFVRTNMKPAPPTDLFTPADEIFPDDDLTKLKDWAKKCAKNVQLETKLIINGNSLYLIKRGVPTPSGRVQDMTAKNIPLFIVYYIHNPKKNLAYVTPAEQLGFDKLPLTTIATETDGAEFAINGGYFGTGVGQIIGVLRSRGNDITQKFWPHRSGIAWNDRGEHKFFDGKNTQTVVNDRAFDKYTEVFQAGPMLIFNGQISQNTEDINADVMNKRHPRTFVAEQRDGTLVWGVIDGRNAAHSVGMTINELKRFCKEQHFVNALNLDGGGSSSVWWNGLRFSKPCNQFGAERKIPYAIVIYRENQEVIYAPLELTTTE